MPRAPKYKLAAEEYLNSQRKKLRPRTTIAAYQTALNNILAFWKKHKWPEDPQKVTASHVLDYLDYTQEVYSAKTQSQYVGVLIRMLVKAKNLDAQEMELNIHLARPDVTWLTVDEAKRVMAAAKEGRPEIYAAVVLMLYLGLRRAEALSVRFSDVEGKAELRLVGKGRKERRLPLDAAVHSALRSFLEQRRTMETGSPLLLAFYSRRQWRTVSEDVLEKEMQKIGQSLGLHLTPHVLRRSFGRHLWDMGVPLETIRDLYGHSSLDTTIQYLGLGQQDLARGLMRRPEYT